jgi:hypothetical protein
MENNVAYASRNIDMFQPIEWRNKAEKFRKVLATIQNRASFWDAFMLTIKDREIYYFLRNNCSKLNFHMYLFEESDGMFDIVFGRDKESVELYVEQM